MHPPREDDMTPEFRAAYEAALRSNASSNELSRRFGINLKTIRRARVAIFKKGAAHERGTSSRDLR